jgi:2'-5' RNA ligase
VARHFFAVWPDAASAAALARLAVRLAAETGGRATPEAKIHLTLAFLGPIDPGTRALAVEAAGETRGRAFGMSVDRRGGFRRARVAWAGASQAPAELLRLQSTLAAALRARGIELEDRPFVPHVTLVRNATRVVAGPIDAIAWRTDAFTLVRSETGKGQYVVEERWPLEG